MCDVKIATGALAKDHCSQMNISPLILICLLLLMRISFQLQYLKRQMYAYI